jgi:bifunctional DNase/RNase
VADALWKVSVANVRTAVAAGPGVEAGLVTLREDDAPNRSFDIIIGQPEARAILSAWTGTASSRPSTWDLMVSGLTALGGRVARAVITDVEDQRYFFATIELERDGDRRVLSARPSDAVALALRAYDAEICVAESVMVALGMPAPAPHESN